MTIITLNEKGGSLQNQQRFIDQLNNHGLFSNTKQLNYLLNKTKVSKPELFFNNK